MAMIDYGALVKKNGKIINRDIFFMDMQEAVGWVDYPRKRYDDCNCLNDGKFSNCNECNRVIKKHHVDDELGEWDSIVADCKGNQIYIEDKIDRNYFAYAGDENFIVAVYKTYCLITNKNRDFRFNIDGYVFDDKDWIVKNLNILTKNGTVQVKIKRIKESDKQFYMKFVYYGDFYEIVYGYGVDSNERIWNKVKDRYIGRKDIIKFIDKFWIEK